MNRLKNIGLSVVLLGATAAPLAAHAHSTDFEIVELGVRIGSAYVQFNDHNVYLNDYHGVNHRASHRYYKHPRDKHYHGHSDRRYDRHGKKYHGKKAYGKKHHRKHHYQERQYREHQYREHQYREHQYREHQYRERRGHKGWDN